MLQCGIAAYLSKSARYCRPANKLDTKLTERRPRRPQCAPAAASAAPAPAGCGRVSQTSGISSMNKAADA